MVVSTEQAKYSIKPEKGTPSIDTSTWPLLLKVSHLNYILLSHLHNEYVIMGPQYVLSLQSAIQWSYCNISTKWKPFWLTRQLVRYIQQINCKAGFQLWRPKTLWTNFSISFDSDLTLQGYFLSRQCLTMTKKKKDILPKSNLLESWSRLLGYISLWYNYTCFFLEFRQA